MRILLSIIVILISLCPASRAGQVTLGVNNQPNSGTVVSSDEILIGTNEVATVKSLYGVGSGTYLYVIKNGITNSLWASQLQGGGSAMPLPLPTVAGPATLRLIVLSGVSQTWNCTVKIEPESFPPGQTIILPEGTIGVVHVESSTNLIQWQDEWVHSFSNTNQNRFYRLRAERSLP